MGGSIGHRDEHGGGRGLPEDPSYGSESYQK
jgi:hypothetical protein